MNPEDIVTEKKMSGHSPGPWAWWNPVNNTAPCMKFLTAANGLLFARTAGRSEPEDTANANLMIAAPDLLAALRLCRSVLNEVIVAADDVNAPLIRTAAKAAEQADRAIAQADGAQ